MSRLAIVFYIIVQYFTFTKLTVCSKDLDVFIPILNDSIECDYNNLNNTNILRYGHHRIQDCGDFKKSFICVMKCLELKYDIAQSDINCKCTCFKDYTKAKYYGNVTKGWTVPTTSLPPWAVVSNTNNNFVQLKEVGDEHQDRVVAPLNNIKCNSTNSNGAVTNIESTIVAENQEGVSNILDVEYRVTKNSLETVNIDGNTTDGDDQNIEDSHNGDTTVGGLVNEGAFSNAHPTEGKPFEEDHTKGNSSDDHTNDPSEGDPSKDNTEGTLSEDQTEAEPSETHTEIDPVKTHIETAPSEVHTKADQSENYANEGAIGGDLDSTEAA